MPGSLHPILETLGITIRLLRQQRGLSQEALANLAHIDRSYSAVWTGDAGFEATAVVGLDPAAQFKRCRELAAQGYRMASISAAKISPGEPPVTASVWHRPAISEQTKDQVAERQARAAVA